MSRSFPAPQSLIKWSHCHHCPHAGNLSIMGAFFPLLLSLPPFLYLLHMQVYFYLLNVFLACLLYSYPLAVSRIKLLLFLLAGHPVSHLSLLQFFL